jgi:glutamate/tyrosine decarboxylase-like PLP-dependent enzyme
VTFPKQGSSPADVLASLQKFKEDDGDWKRGRIFSLVYHAGEAHTKLLHDAYGLFFMENGLNPMAFPSLRRFETEVLRAVAGHHHLLEAHRSSPFGLGPITRASCSPSGCSPP